MLIEEIYKIYQQYPSIQTDTRKLQQDDLFFALKGPNFNGNLYAAEALKKGAAYVFVDEEITCTDKRIIQTKNVLETLQDLARFHRLQFNTLPGGKSKIPFIAITGSNGKTTTKELLHSVLSTTYKTYTTEGNLNNHIGIPLTILKIKPDAQIAVIEMGANHLHEIAGYCAYAMPNYGLITNIGKAHLEGFGGIENVKKGKGELFDYLRNNEGTAFVNSDDPAVVALSNDLNKKVFYGISGKDYSGKIIKSDPFPEIQVEGEPPIDIQTNLAGDYNFPNVLAAVAIGKYFKIKDNKVKIAIENYRPSNSRSQLIKIGSNTVILDAYNANPGSMKAAIENFASLKGSSKILLLGSMMELGNESKKEHEDLISLVNQFKWKKVVLVGKNFNELVHDYINYENAAQVKKWLNEQHFENTMMLIKGSRSMQMEKILE
ncbi:MAG: UDP-N-acetylmuramoyl-tripeptide--D-alanyl-D-alanine ligase [Ginsengibacter sp.]